MARKTLEQRFERQVDRSGEHHLWTGAKNVTRGTGRIWVGKKDVTAHRMAWELAHGTLGANARVQTCGDEPACVRIEHLTVQGDKGVPLSAPARRSARGGGSKRQLRSGTWELAVAAGRDESDRKRRVFRTFHGTETEASRALAALVAEVGNGEAWPVASAAGLTVEILLDEYVRHLDEDKGRKHSTLVRYRGLARTWVVPVIGASRVSRVLPQDFETLLGKMRREGQSQSSIHQVFTLLNGAFKWAKRNRRVTQNPLADVEEPRSAVPAREVMPPDLASLLLLLSTALEDEYEFGIACHLGAATGMRRGELAGLRWSRIDLANAQVRVESTVNDAGGTVVFDDFTKTRRSRRISLDPDTIAALRGSADRRQGR